MPAIDRRTFIRCATAAGPLLALSQFGCQGPEPRSSTGQLVPETLPIPPFELEEMTIQKLRQGIETGRFSCRAISFRDVLCR